MNPYKETQRVLKGPEGEYLCFHLPSLEKAGYGKLGRLPYSVRILLESALRNVDDRSIKPEDVKRIAGWRPEEQGLAEIPFKPGRVLLQDFTGVPSVVDLAAMRDALKKLGGDYKKINPQVPCDLVVDHSVQVDAYGSKNALAENVSKEFERNAERYAFLKWAKGAFKNFRVVPPSTGIVHQVNLEYLATGVMSAQMGTQRLLFPDSLVGTDSHTTMINGLGIVGWGVGGIEAEAVMLGEPIFMLLPKVMGFRLKGKLKEGVTATDLVLTVTQILRAKGVVGQFVEYFGEGLSQMSLPDRATVANMAPEYGATMGFFPPDEETMRYYLLSGRSKAHVDLMRHYLKQQQLFYDVSSPQADYSSVLEFDLAKVEPCLAGPKRPQDRIALNQMKESFKKSFSDVPATPKGSALTHGSIAIAAITSCTNTSNPSVMIAAGLLAKKAVERGLSLKPYVKTSLAPGSLVVTEYLKKAGLLTYLEKLKFNVVGYGCTTCIGNSGPLPDEVARLVKEKNLVMASVLSGNRNFEARINPLVKANYLMSPPLVVAFALAGRVDINLGEEPLGLNSQGEKVFLKELWPSQAEVNDVVKSALSSDLFKERYAYVFEGSSEWNSIQALSDALYPWDAKSTYIQKPGFFEGLSHDPAPPKPIKSARVLVMLGDSVTTDHISPAGAISPESPAGKYLIASGVAVKDFNSYGSRRGNDRVMVRGTFANARLRNLLTQKEGSWTYCFPEKKEISIFDAAAFYRDKKISLIVLAGMEYGSGSSRDWAAKGTALLGIAAVLAGSFERIHRSNLIGMGVLPLQFKKGDTYTSLGLKGDEVYDLISVEKGIEPRQEIEVIAKRGEIKISFKVISRIDTPVEAEYYRNGGILQTVLRKLAKNG